MNEQEFLEELGKWKGKFRILADGEIRSKGCYKQNKGSLCPIEAACKSNTNEVTGYWNAASILQMSDSLRDRIVKGADNPPPLANKIRAKMLKVLDLKENK